MSTPETDRCTECGAILHSVGGGPRLCPACSMRLALEPRTEVTQAAGAGAAATHEPEEGELLVGRYRLIETVGEGGMGQVFRAEQQEPVRREVAVKFVKWGMDTREVVARFEAERQALALMSHPAIARVFDGGATPEGRPYFVMEYVRGVPITEFCDRHRLPIDERLRLFMQVCDGVQHAHQKGIIHRDLKPSNVLVAYEDGRPAPKVIDFGIAKATGLRLTQETLYTQIGRPIGTPAYMSPEQADAGAADIDTRTDVYSLGVILYELLVGASPFEPSSLAGASYEEILRRIRDSDPPRPSTRFSSLGADTRDSAHQRGVDAPVLRRRLRGDLDWIVMRALEKDRSRRYGSPAELAADIQRHLDDEPVLAGPPDLRYRLGKLVRRHRLAFVAAAIVAIGVVTAVAGTTVGLVRARRAEAVAAAEAAKATAINEFLQDVLGSADPYERLGRDVTVIEALDEAVDRVETDFADQPEIRAAVEATIGRTYGRLSRYAEAKPLLAAALATTRELHPGDHPETADLLLRLGWLERINGDPEEALRRDDEALEMLRRLHGGVHTEVARALSEKAWALNDASDFAAAETYFREALAIRSELYRPPHLELAETQHGLAMLLGNKGEYDEAIPLYREAMRQRVEILGPRHLSVAASQTSLGLVLQSVGEHDEAAELLQASLDTRRELLGDEHHEVAESWSSLGTVLFAKNEIEAAEEAFRTALVLFERLFPEGHTKVARAHHNVSTILAEKGEIEGAIEAERHALQQNLDVVGPEHVVSGVVRLQLSDLLLRARDYPAAEREAREGLRVISLTLPASHWRIGGGKGRLGEALTGLGRYEEAEPLLLEAIEILRASRPPGSSIVRVGLQRLEQLYESWGRPDEAAKWRAEVEALG